MPKEAQKQGRALNSAKRSPDELVQGMKEWVEKKFKLPKKVKMMKSLCDATWSSELVINVVKSQDEVGLIRKHKIKVIELSDIIKELNENSFSIKYASGGDFVDLVNMQDCRL